MLSPSKEKLPALLLNIFYLCFFAGVIFFWRAVASISLGLIFFTGVANTKIDSGNFRNRHLFSPFFVSCISLFMLAGLALLYTTNMQEGIVQLQKKSGIVFIPLALFYSVSFLNREKYEILMYYFTLFIFLACFSCIAIAFINYFKYGNASVFFYHDLSKGIRQHAIQFSILIFFDILFLFQCLQANGLLKQKQLVALLIFFSFILLLLSSKLILLFYFFYLVYFVIRHHRKHGQKKLLLFMLPLSFAVALMAIASPLNNRFQNLLSGDNKLFLQDKFEPGTYFNGVQFRLLQWRITAEILDEKKAWLLGVGHGDAQDILNQKYLQKNMYVGEAGQKGGYWNYHTHNQFLQTVLQNGLVGLAVLLLFWIALWLMSAKCNNSVFKIFIFLLLLYSFTDAPLESQYGIVLLIFLPLFSFLSHSFNTESEGSI